MRRRENQPRPTEAEIEQRRIEYEEWIQEKEQELEESDVEFIHHFERETLADQNGHRVDVEVLKETLHISDLSCGLVAELADGDDYTERKNKYYYTNNLHIDLAEKLAEDDVQVADNYDKCNKYDYKQLNNDIVAQII
ncbi:hypothetical protein [Halobacterium salinarum]|uniref:hypothetical protein n=1 Tax=Halobacterium salinarum TaxID=2242 RepID=UPI0025576708|nr:hypothetical protein [Halobacterium salinarum]MDL0144535.1 hypothetical protein [Halobacterium salinarum]